MMQAAETASERRITIVQGEFAVSDHPEAVIVTLLGSCVAACVRDPIAKVGGMNHFLLPPVEERERGAASESYAVHLMELLVNALMRQGAHRDRLEAKLFGGARMSLTMPDIGARNIEFAQRFLKNEGISLIGSSVGGNRGRRVQYWPVSGRARQIQLNAVDDTSSPVMLPKLQTLASGNLDLF